MRKIDLIIIHCSATREGHALSPSALEACHRRRGFITTGYHYYIRRTGELHVTRPPEWVGAHARGHNAHSIGICYEGGLDARGHAADTRTPAQRRVMHELVARLRKRFPGCRVLGHRDLSPDRNHDGRITPDERIKECPCFEVRDEFPPETREGCPKSL